MKVHSPISDEQKAAINDMLQEVLNVETPADIYEEAKKYVSRSDIQEAANNGELTIDDIGATYSVAGFIVGFKYALEHIEKQE